MAATVGILNGVELCVYSDTNKIAYSQSCKLTTQCDMRDTTNKDSGGWKTVLPGLQSWTMETSGLVALDTSYNLVYLMGLLLAKTQVTLKFKTSNADDAYYSGTAYITNVGVDSPNQNNVSYTVSFVGTAALSVTQGSSPT